MSFRRPAAGRRVAGGVLRVDAARAIAKLRDYQLADPCAWILEAIRAAVASGATRISLDGDANDIWLSWQGGKWPMERLPDLLSELVSPGGPCGREFRLLATGINSALGLQSAYIDVYGFSEKGCQKVRFSPALLQAGEEMGNASPIDALTLEQVKVPPKAPEGCVLFIHLRRRIGMAVLRNFLNREPPEFALVRSSCRELAIPIAVAGKQVEAARTELLRLPLGRDLDGFIALVETGSPENGGGQLSGGEGSGVKLEVAEYGVAITDYVVSVSDVEPQHAMPIRACINAERMPTNASRSGVRRGDHPLRETEAQLPKCFSELCQLMIEESGIEGARGRRIGDSIVRLLAAVISGKGWCRRTRHLAAPYSDMAALPLLQNAVGHWQPMNIVWERDIVYTGKVPLSAEFEPWVQAIVWAPVGSAAAALVGTEILPVAMEVRLRRAKTELRSQRRFMAQKERPTSLKRPPRHWVQCSVSANISDTCAPPLNSVFEGELYLLQKGEGSKLTLLLDGKEIETLDLRSLLPMRALVSSDMLRAESDYQSVKRNRGFEKVVEATHRSAIRCVEAMCLDGAQGYQYREAASSAELHGLVVKALAMARELGLSVASASPMAKVMLWPLARGKGLASLLALRSENAVGISLLGNFTGEVGERPVVLCSSAWESEVLETALILETALVDKGESYTHVVHYNFDVRDFDPMKKAKLVSKTHRGVSMIFAGGGMRGVMSWGLESQEDSIHIHHCGRIVERVRHEGLLSPGFISVDSDSIVPSPTWGRAVAGILSGSDFLEVELEFVREFARALVGEAVPTLFSEGPLSLHNHAGQAFAGALRALGNWQETLGAPLVRRLTQTPIFATLSGEMCSASELAAVDSSAIEFLKEIPPELAREALSSRGLPRLEWNPLIASAEIAGFAGGLARRSPNLASAALQRELIRCKREAHMLRHGKKHVMRPALARASLMPGAEGVVEFSFQSAKGLVGISDRGSVMHFFVDNRIFQSVQVQGPLPIVALLSIDSTSIDESFTELLPERVNQFFEELNALAPEIIEQGLSDTPNALERPGHIRSFCLGWLIALEDFSSHWMDFSDSKKRSRIFSIAKFSDQRGTLRPLEEYVEAGVMRTAAVLQNSWVDAAPGQDAEALDKPVLSFEQEHQIGTFRLLRSLYEDGVVADYSDAIAKMQVERRLSLGLLLLPTVPVDPRYKRRLSDLGDSDKLGEIGFHQGEQSELRFYESGEIVARRNVAQRPPLWVAIDDPSLDRIDLDGDVEPELRDQLVALTLALAISVVESAETGELPSWLRESLSDALLCGQLAPVAGLRQVPLFMTTNGEAVSWDALVEQENSFGGVWYTDVSDTREPIAKGQFALALRLSELELCDDLLFWPAYEDLALDQISRTNRARPKVSSVELSAAEELSVIRQMPLRGLDGLSGVV
ncbi:MAG: hypothetical protein JKY56_07995, partial [Kofleriaceae bacterium]|nr:hypothetical protein [Kofleriaceae bacterium]